MNAFALHDGGDQDGMARWTVAAGLILAAHAGLILLATTWWTQSLPPGVPLPVITVDLAPPTALSSAQPTVEAPPGPAIEQAEPPPPPVPQQRETIEEQVVPAPAQEAPKLEALPPEKTEVPPPVPEQATVVPEHAAPVKPKLVHPEVKKPAEKPPAPRTTAPPRNEHATQQSIERQTSASSGVASAAAIASYNRIVAAHLQKFMQYPPASKAAGEQGVSRLSFTLGRNGQVLGSRLAGSSGHPALDSETMAMVRRAQPFPPMPADLKQASMSFTVPIRFSIR